MKPTTALLLASTALALFAPLAACSNDTTTVAQFTASTTAPEPGLVKFVLKSRSGSRVVVDAVLFGPEPGLDLFGFELGIAVGDSDVLRFVPQDSYTQTALVAGAGQTIGIDVDGSDPSLVQVDVTKLGGGAGNGFGTNSVVVIELSFDARRAGTSTLSFVGLDGNPPRAVDAARAPIGAVRFDAQAATVMGVVTGGGGY